MKKIIFYIFTIITTITTAIGQIQNAKTENARIVILYEDGTWIYKDSLTTDNLKASIINKLEIPKTSSKDDIISHTGYSLLYNEPFVLCNSFIFVSNSLRSFKTLSYVVEI